MKTCTELALSNKSQIRSALDLLRRFLHARTGEPLLAPDDLAPLETLVKDEPYFSASLPRVLLAGKFKAGKSTLVNSLLGSTLAATDLFEMTAWVARYWPSAEPFCRLVFRNGIVKEMNPSEFFTRCQERTFTPEELNAIVAVDVGTGPTPAAIALIDAPGTGGMNRDNEKRLVEALRDADVVAWVSDITALGDARESALVQTLLEQDTPLIVILTKCDFASADEVEEAKQFLKSNYRLDQSPIFDTAALSKTDVGVSRLRDYLNREVMTQHAELRVRAQQAHDTRIFELTQRLLDQVHSELAYWSNNAGRFALIAKQMCESVQIQLEADISNYVRSGLFGERRDKITSALQKSVADGKGALSQERISEIFSSALGPRYLDEFWANLLNHVRGAGSELWKERIKDQIKELEECCGIFKDDVIRHIGLEINDDQIRFQAGEIALQQAGVVMSGAAVAATLGTAAAMGNATFAAAATGIGLPIAATGAVLAGAMYLIQRQRAIDSIRSQAHTYLDECTEAFLRDVVQKQFFPQIRDVNARIAGEMVAAFKEAIATRLPEGDLETLLSDVSNCRATIS